MCRTPAGHVGSGYKRNQLITAQLRYREDSLRSNIRCLAPLPKLWGKSPNPVAESASCERYSLSLGPVPRGVQRGCLAEHFGPGGWYTVEAKLCEWQSYAANTTELTLSVSPPPFLILVLKMKETEAQHVYSVCSIERSGL